jgi:protein SCO1/2
MKYSRTIRRTVSQGGIGAALCCALLAASARGQVSSYGDKQVLQQVGVTQRLNQMLPLDARFVDDTGKNVRLGDYFGKRPAILSLVYYNCPMLCSEEMDGIASALEMVRLTPGKDFEIILISIDPSETPEIAAKKKAFYLKRYGRPETANGWHYLTGKQPGPDGKLDQFAHASAIEVVTTDGRLAQYYLGVEFSPKDILLGLIEASGNKIGSPVANILTYCYHYDPQTNKHSLIVARVVQLGGMMTVVSLGSFMFVMFRRDIQLGRNHDLTSKRTDDEG